MNVQEKPHALHVYDNEASLLEAVLEFYRNHLPQGGTAVAVTRRRMATRLQGHFDNSTRVPEVHLVVVDADEMLNLVMYGGRPDEERFRASVGQTIEQYEAGGPVAVFGEMVAVLWERGEADAALELERFWNSFVADHGLTRLCAYSARSLGDPAAKAKVAAMYSEHSLLDVPRGLAQQRHVSA